MCWSGDASTVLAVAGLGTTAYLALKKKEKVFWIVLGYFSLMELLQAFSYQYMDMCSSRVNHMLTVLGFMHICFQPFFINAISLHFIPESFRKKIAPWTYAICFVGSIVLLLKLYPFHLVTGIGEGCTSGAICGTSLCSVTGSWHIAWDIPLNDMSVYIYALAYAIPAFVVPMFYGSWRVTIYHALVGPSLAYLLTDNINEWPAIWCLFSIGLLLVVVVTPFRKLMYVKKWYFWRYPFEKRRKKS